MKCDIIIPVWNQLEFTKDCIENIRRNTGYPYRLILVDNASDGETDAYLKSLKDDRSSEVELIRNEENLGFVKAVNQGLRISNAPYVCILNNDTVPAPGWLEKMVRFAEGHKDIGLINPQSDGHLDVPIEAYAGLLEKNKGKYMEMNQCHGFCMLVKREVIDRIGPLDESFGIGGFDDTDYSMRAHRAGYRSVCVYDAYVYHRLHASFDKAGDREEWVRRNQKVYYDKWGKHLRVGVAFPMENFNADAISRLVTFAYGLAREWSWVHIWVNFNGEADLIKKAVEECMDRNDLPPHQNIRMNYFRLPKVLFDLTLAGKLLERMRSRMRDKRFDAVILFDDKGFRVTSAVSKTMNLYTLSPSFRDGSGYREKEGRDTAILIKEKRESRGRR